MQRDLTYFVAIHIGFLLVLQTRLLTLNVNFEAKHKSGHIMNKMENSKNHVLQVIWLHIEMGDKYAILWDML